MTAALVSACALALGLAIALLRARRDAGRLRLRVEDATQNLEHLQRSFSRFAPDDVVEEVIARGASTHGERREVTVLFADLVGFTTLSDTVDPTTLVTILNGYAFTFMDHTSSGGCILIADQKKMSHGP